MVVEWPAILIQSSGSFTLYESANLKKTINYYWIGKVFFGRLSTQISINVIYIIVWQYLKVVMPRGNACLKKSFIGFISYNVKVTEQEISLYIYIYIYSYHKNTDFFGEVSAYNLIGCIGQIASFVYQYYPKYTILLDLQFPGRYLYILPSVRLRCSFQTLKYSYFCIKLSI